MNILTTDKASKSGLAKVALLKSSPVRYLLRSILAGMYLSIVVFVYWSLINNINDHSIGKVLGSLFFGVGLSIIVFTNSELFTSNCMYLAISSAKGTTTWAQTIKLWTVCYLGNLLGAIFLAMLLMGAGTLNALPETHAIYTGAAAKVNQGAMAIFIKGILANWVVCLAVWVALRLKEEMAKMMAMICVVFIFLYLGFEHSIANMGTFAFVIMGQNVLTFIDLMHSMFYATLGNIVGGAVFVGLPYYYLNHSAKSATVANSTQEAADHYVIQD